MPSSLPKSRRLHRAGAELPMYRRPSLYDLAFGFRDIPAECKGILRLASRYGVRRPRSVLELACGPAHHLRELARSGLTCVGFDINPEMLGYARELARRDGVRLSLRRADMRTFKIAGRRFDLALCLFDSFAQCVTDHDAIETLRHTGAALRRGGLAFVEFTHPADYFGKGRSRTSERWTVGRGERRVRARFSLTRFDPVEETFVASLVIEPRRRNGNRSARRLAMRWPQHMWLRGGVRYVVAASGCLDVLGWYGDIDPVRSLDMSERSWRMIAVLKKR